MAVKFVFAIAVSVVISYLLGSINSSIITVKLMKGEDIREHGSGNAGLTNTLRCYGKLPALFTLVGDLLKGVVAVILCRLICLWLGVGMGADNNVYFIGYVAGFFAVIGHIFPVYYGFKGGKGVLVGVASFLVIDPLVFGVLIGIFIIVLAISRYVSLSSIIATCCCPFVTFLMQHFVENEPVGYSLVYSLMTLPICTVIIIMHRSNIRRLKNGTENRFSFGKKEDK